MRLEIWKLETGYLVSTGAPQMEPIAAASSFTNLVEFLWERFGEEEDRPKPASAVATRIVRVDGVKRKVPAEPPPSEPAPEAAKEPLSVSPSGLSTSPQRGEERPEPAEAATQPDPPLTVQETAKPQPSAPSTQLRPAQERVYDHLCLCAVKTGSEVVMIEMKTLADKAGVPPTSIYGICEALDKKGLVAMKKNGAGVAPTFTVHGALDELED